MRPCKRPLFGYLDVAASLARPTGSRGGPSLQGTDAACGDAQAANRARRQVRPKGVSPLRPDLRNGARDLT